MAYFIDLFSPETYAEFSKSSRDISGFRERHKNVAARVQPGDFFICYVTRLSRWVGVLQVVEGPFLDGSPVFVAENDPFVVRFQVKADTWLDLEHAIPIHEDKVWKSLTFTRELPAGSLAWTGKVRGSLVRLEDADGEFLSSAIRSQAQERRLYPIAEQDRKKLDSHRVVREDKVITVSVPEETTEQAPSEARESIRMQAMLAKIGEQMGMQIWLPRADRAAVLREWKAEEGSLLERLPLNYDETTLRTVENIDVLWLKRRSIVRAFEVEHTTSVYSGILRMADLLALQPNMDIKLHIVAPDAKREKVFQEIRRPVFSLLERGPLAESCTYLSYEGLREISGLKHLTHISDSVLDEYAEEAE
jgi:hypothetical protein